MVKNRNEVIDVLRGLLTLLMVSNHLLPLPRTMAELINLVVFSGFMFCAGVSGYNAYFFGDANNVKKRLIKNSVKLYLAYLISAFFRMLIYEKSFDNLLAYVSVSKEAGLSEFLLSWSVLYLLLLVAHKPLKWVFMSRKRIVLLMIVTLCFTFVPARLMTISLLGPLIGISEGGCFPIVQYFSLYLLGVVYRDGNEKPIQITIFSYVCSIVVTVCIIYECAPRRFPPSILWVTGAYGYILGAFFILDALKYCIFKGRLALKIAGRNSLLFLLISNFFAFARGIFEELFFTDEKMINIVEYCVYYFVVMSLLYVLAQNKEKLFGKKYIGQKRD